MRKLTKRKLLCLISVLQKFERVRRVIYEYEKVFFRDVEDAYAAFRAKLSGFSVFEVCIWLLAFKRYFVSGGTDRFFEKKSREILKKEAIIKRAPVIEEADYFYDSNYNMNPGCDYKNSFYFGDAEINQTVACKDFSQRSDYLYGTVFTERDDFVVDCSKYQN